jgi:hypothetical protein
MSRMSTDPTSLDFLTPEQKATAIRLVGADHLTLIPDEHDAQRVADGSLPAKCSPGYTVLGATNSGGYFPVGRIVDQRWNRSTSRRTKNPIWAYVPISTGEARHTGWAYDEHFDTPPADQALDTWAPQS